MLDDLMAAIERAVETALLNEADGRVVLEYTERLYKELYQGYDEFKEADVMLQDRILTYSEEAREEGIKEGMEKNALEVARKMLARGEALPDIVEIAGLSIDKIQALTGH